MQKDVQKLIEQYRNDFTGLNPPAQIESINRLEQQVGAIPEEVKLLYRNHDGCSSWAKSDRYWIVARLMPIHEVLLTQNDLSELSPPLPTVGKIIWLWTDDNSNYCGLYLDGPLTGWMTILDHDEPMAGPAFRSLASFLSHLLADSRKSGDDERALDLPTLPRDIPETATNAANVEGDRRLASEFREEYQQEAEDDLKRLYAHCAICLTPVEDTREVLNYLNDADMWTPETAVRLLELRHWDGPVGPIERLAREGRPNGDSAAMRLLARMHTDDSRAAIVRLKQTLTGQKLKSLKMWTENSRPLQPPKW